MLRSVTMLASALDEKPRASALRLFDAFLEVSAANVHAALSAITAGDAASSLSGSQPATRGGRSSAALLSRPAEGSSPCLSSFGRVRRGAAATTVAAVSRARSR
jgi:hypothetical protein